LSKTRGLGTLPHWETQHVSPTEQPGQALIAKFLNTSATNYLYDKLTTTKLAKHPAILTAELTAYYAQVEPNNGSAEARTAPGARRLSATKASASRSSHARKHFIARTIQHGRDPKIPVSGLRAVAEA
jgi:hypothetical protein